MAIVFGTAAEYSGSSGTNSAFEGSFPGRDGKVSGKDRNDFDSSASQWSAASHPVVGKQNVRKSKDRAPGQTIPPAPNPARSAACRDTARNAPNAHSRDAYAANWFSGHATQTGNADAAFWDASPPRNATRDAAGNPSYDAGNADASRDAANAARIKLFG